MAAVRLALLNPDKYSRASPMLCSYPSLSVHANAVFSPNKQLSIKPVLLGVNWIPLILRLPVVRGSTRATILVGQSLCE